MGAVPGRSTQSLAVTVVDELWNALDNALTLKRRRGATIGRLIQLLQKRFPDMPGDYLSEENCLLSREMLTASQLQQCDPRHDRAEPYQMHGPVVVFEHAGQRYIFDGTNRLNVWLRSWNTERHETIIVRRRGT
jgi:hypothetical protein